MKVYQDGKAVKNATVIYNPISGKESAVIVGGTRYNARAFTFEDEKPSKKTRTVKKTVKKNSKGLLGKLKK